MSLPRFRYSQLLRCSTRLSAKPSSLSRLRPFSAMASKQSQGSSAYTPRYIDIGINLADPIFRGLYHGKQRHPDDLGAVISRAKEVGCQKLIVTGSDLTNSKEALEIAKEYPGVVYTTAGIHPCSSAIFSSSHKPRASEGGEGHTEGQSTPCDPDPSQPISEDHDACPKKTSQIIASLQNLIAEAQASTPGALVAFGEFGLDYDRLHYCSRKVQLHSFAAQLDLVLAMKPQLPLFLHSRAAHADFVGLLKDKFGPRLERLEKGGVVHSFTGTAEEMRELMDLGLYIGTNGCSFKTAENCDVVKEIKLDRLMLETDGPWCEVRPSHEGGKYLVSKINADREAEAAAAAVAAAEAAEATEPQNDNVEAGEKPTQETPVLAAATAALASASLAPPSSSTLGSSSSPGQTGTTATTTTTTTTNSAGTNTPSTRTHTPGPKPRRKPPAPKQTKKEPEVPERWKSVKKEKWVEGAMVKSRNEPCMIERVGTVVAAIKGVSVEEVCEAAWENTCRVFKLE
ncbi:uncharacterized protein B0I36DRAFT_333894 [Microdochium trichocladiopsis]|uniref:Uncharacterized protein n=1 Tax=Microdochium trichocladiopsis TaxID=1682393 RepID=A0A9P9BL03_9PEZI|nr:uncharacterized protein B0I36DRAFT_333894 [Microdochium trichocladiopsis]KAH7021162.1 hypothetical protein B0I36DRAFT_333894 [Microdochium trichocladiopsis]